MELSASESLISRKNLKRLLTIVIIAVLVTAGYFYFRHYENLRTIDSITGKSNQLLVSATSKFFQPVQVVRLDKNITAPLQVEGQGTSIVMDAVTNGTSSAAYLIADPLYKVSNIYLQDRAKRSAGLSQVTDSKSFKYDLSFDFDSGSAVYLSTINSSTSEPHVFLYTRDGKKEVDLGSGTHPTLLSGGFFVMFQKGDTVVVKDTVTKRTTSLFTIGSSTPFAVDGKNKIIALYNPISKSVDQFSFAGTVTASYMSSTPLASAPATISYIGEKLMITSKSESGSGTVFTVVPGGPSYTVTIPGITESYKLYASHE
jgi:hypothetical protein